MPYNPDIYHRRSIRLLEYDYSQPGAYFVTVCAKHKECLFGEIVAGEMRLNGAGEIVAKEWLQTGNLRPNIILDEWVVMPNHFHGIVIINPTTPVGARLAVPLQLTSLYQNYML